MRAMLAPDVQYLLTPRGGKIVRVQVPGPQRDRSVGYERASPRAATWFVAEPAQLRSRIQSVHSAAAPSRSARSASGS
jgi:hypothetical protein